MLNLPSLPSLKPRALFGICNALLDITSEVDEEYLKRYGLLPNNAILANDETVGLTQDMVTQFPVKYTAGGAGQNTVRAAQWKLPKNSTMFVSCVGEDEFAVILKREALADGVDVHYMQDSSQPTGTCATLISNEGLNRSLVANLGAALSMNREFILKNQHLLDEANVFYVTGFMMNVSIDVVLHIAEHAFAQHKTFALNLSAPFVSQFYGKELMAAYLYADIVFGNESEISSFAALNNLPQDSPEETVHAMANLPKKPHGASDNGKRVVIITRGALPIIVSDGATTMTIPVPAVPREELIDANGAGDAFAGGFLASFLLGKSLVDCINLGNEVAGYILRTSGISFPRA